MNDKTETKIWVTIIIVVISLGIIAFSIQAVEAPNKTITSTEYTNTTLTTSTIITHMINSTTSTISCKTIINATGIQGQINGALPNGTKWVSIYGKVYSGKQILNGTYPYNVASDNNGNNIVPHWWIISNC